MIDLSIIEEEISMLEQEEDTTTYDVCERLAYLYIVRNNILSSQNEKEDTSPVSSEFLEACVGVSLPEPMKIINEHMEAIKIVYPVEYNAVLNKILSLHKSTQS